MNKHENDQRTPVWAIYGVASIVLAVSMVFAVYGIVAVASTRHWPPGLAILMIAATALIDVAIVLTILASILRAIDRRRR